MPGPAIPLASAGTLSLRMLGGFSARLGDREIALPTVKSRMLLAYLASAPGRLHPRGRLCGLFWEDRAEEQARGSLRNALSHLRAALGEGAVIGNREAVGLQARRVESDLARLETLAETGAADPREVPALTQNFLDGIEAEGALLGEWLEFERSRCRSLSQKLIEITLDECAQAGAYMMAIELARNLVALDPFREASQRRLIRLLADSGDRAMALAQFHACRDLLRRELGIAPSVQTQMLANELTDEPREAPIHRAGQRDFSLSVAVLPFADADGDPDGRFLAEGLADDITTELTRHRDILVISRLSSFQFHPAHAGEAAQDLGARYVLTGAVRRRADRVSLSVRLLDATSGRNLWAERYERPLADLFEVQEAVVSQILAGVDAEIRQSERERAVRRQPSDLDAWELFHRGLWHAYRFQPEEAARARAIFARAAELAPDFALPLAGLAYIGLVGVTWRMAADPQATLIEAIAQGRLAVVKDPTAPFSQVVLGRLLTYAGDLPAAFDHLRLARDLNPSYASTYYGLATAHLWSNQAQAALDNAEQALRFSPRDPLAAMFITVQSFALILLGRPDQAQSMAHRAVAMLPGEIWSRLALTCALSEQGRPDEARQVLATAKRELSGVSLEGIRPISASVSPEFRDRVLGLLCKAGLD
ncbi:BTAD domain-containing putative transcriptional regulator [Paracoccus ravus]|uniref:BTAD domain-containing putative transcriptional regulator n=1 Tax=Paracoccus ravus TaxID=2447760 RepID=UPI00106EF851|nr:BTAD domain-containing putative transcriptional regulator [Paracoccus ravus]